MLIYLITSNSVCMIFFAFRCTAENYHLGSLTFHLVLRHSFFFCLALAKIACETKLPYRAEYLLHVVDQELTPSEISCSCRKACISFVASCGSKFAFLDL